MADTGTQIFVPANELRIGNLGRLWHFWGSRWVDVVLTGEQIGWVEKGKTSFSPYVLTPERLIKLGARHIQYDQDNAHFVLPKNDGYREVKIILYPSGSYGFEFHTELFYMHQVQNLYYCLNGTELTPKP